MQESIVMWAPLGTTAESLLQKIARASDTAEGNANMYLITPAPNALPGTGLADLQFLWKPYMNERWNTVVKNMLFTPTPTSYIRPGAKNGSHVFVSGGDYCAFQVWLRDWLAYTTLGNPDWRIQWRLSMDIRLSDACVGTS